MNQRRGEGAAEMVAKATVRSRRLRSQKPESAGKPESAAGRRSLVIWVEALGCSGGQKQDCRSSWVWNWDAIVFSEMGGLEERMALCCGGVVAFTTGFTGVKGEGEGRQALTGKRGEDQVTNGHHKLFFQSHGHGH